MLGHERQAAHTPSPLHGSHSRCKYSNFGRRFLRKHKLPSCTNTRCGKQTRREAITFTNITTWINVPRPQVEHSQITMSWVFWLRFNPAIASGTPTMQVHRGRREVKGSSSKTPKRYRVHYSVTAPEWNIFIFVRPHRRCKPNNSISIRPRSNCSIRCGWLTFHFSECRTMGCARLCILYFVMQAYTLLIFKNTIFISLRGQLLAAAIFLNFAAPTVNNCSPVCELKIKSWGASGDEIKMRMHATLLVGNAHAIAYAVGGRWYNEFSPLGETVVVEI
jgi:hypothetical protein